LTASGLNSYRFGNFRAAPLAHFLPHGENLSMGSGINL
jgi:hypothetical protein